jgi:hypothetical protein
MAFQRQVTVANSIFVAPAATESYYVVRVYTTRATHIMIDVLGAVTGNTAAPPSATRAPERRLLRQNKQRARLIRAIQERR